MRDDGLAFSHFMPRAGAGSAEGDEIVGRAGRPLDPGAPAPDRDSVVAALKTVHDPEIPVDIYELGLIYDLELLEGGDVRVEMTLTAPACPVAGELPGQVAEAVAGVDGVGQVEVRLVWEPPWSPERMSEEARVALDMF